MKVWCLHCEVVTEVDRYNFFYSRCSNCGAGCGDVYPVNKENGPMSQAYPNMDYEDFVVGDYYPLYPDKN